MRAIALSLLALACAGGSGGDDDDDDTPAGDTGGGDTTTADEWFIKGWLQQTGESTGDLAESERAALPADCDGDLAATSGELAAVTTRSGMPFLPQADLADWPGRGPVTPLYRVSVDGQATRDGDGALVSVVAEPTGGADTVLYLDVCDTVVERGACHVPGAGFPFDGCVGTFGQDAGFVIGDLELQATEAGFTAAFDYGYTCNNANTRDETHPEGVSFGAQRLTVDGVALPDGERVALPADAVTWSGSVVVQEDCDYVPDAGDICDCVWGFVEDVTLGAAWAQRDGGSVHLSMRGLGADEAFLLWGTFPLR